MSLVVVGTPIGNLEDMSPRAVRTLAEADVVACEDTRRTRKLLSAAGVGARGRLVAIHEHNEASMVPRVLDWLRAGKRVAVVTDAGMPGIADPGERIVAAAVAAGVRVEVVPGPSAVTAALAVSGLPCSRFVFEGFLPRKGPSRAERVAAVATERRTVVLFEAPHRIAGTLADLMAACGPQRRVAVARELTKLFEEVWRGDLAGAVDWVGAAEPRGEYVIVLGGAPEPGPPDRDEIARAVREARAAGATTRGAVDEVARALGVSRRRVYEVAVADGADGPPRGRRAADRPRRGDR